MSTKDELVFADEAPEAEPLYAEPWKLLIADDEEEVHKVTKLALANFNLSGRSLQFLDAYSGREAIGALTQNPDTALVLMDVVMESDTAGLDAIDVIRNKIGNKLVRIVLRTGQPGQAPEREVVMRYDINDYKEKTELTAKKLFTLVYTGLNMFHDMSANQRSRESLERIVDASSTVLNRKLPERLAQGALELLASILSIDQSSVPPRFGALMVTDTQTRHPKILAAIGRYKNLAGTAFSSANLPDVQSRLRSIRRPSVWARGPRFLAVRFDENHGVAIYIEADQAFPPLDSHVLDVYGRNIASALHVAQVHQDMDKTQSDLILMLSEAIERRSRETGNHVRRVGEYSRILGMLSGFNEEEADILMIGAALHDAGKIAIPDAILTKPGKLTPEERTAMETHAEIGGSMFAGKDLPVLQAATIIAHQHHERWDGLGYPKRLKGEDIHPYGRIAALADVFDALGSHRCYKNAWPLGDVLQLLRDERGRHFEPKLVDLFLANLPTFLEVRDRFVDPPPPE